MLFLCGTNYELYNFKTKQRQTVDCRPCWENGQAPIFYHLGARWLEFDEGDAKSGVGPVTGHFFYNVMTHQLIAEPPASRTKFIDLDWPSLTRPVCTPLHTPSNGSLTLIGRFAVLSIGGPFVDLGEQYESFFLERCRSHLRVAIGQRFNHSVPSQPFRLYANTHAVIWPVFDRRGSSWQARFAGLLLPSLRRFTAPLPRNVQIGDAASVALDDSRVYVTDYNGLLWSARFPPSQTRP